MVYIADSDWVELEYFKDELLKKKLVRNWFRLYFFSFLAAPTGYLIKILVARAISVEEIGILYSILSLIGIISSYNDLGLTEALQYYLPHYLIDKKYKEAKSIIIITWIMQLISWIVIWWWLYLAAGYIWANYFHSPLAIGIIKLYSLYFIAINFYQVLLSLFIATQKVKRSQGMDTLRLWAIVVFIVAMFFFNTLNIHTFALSRFFGLIVAIVMWIIWSYSNFSKIFKRYPFDFKRDLIKQQRKYGFWVMMGMGAGVLLWQINQLLAQYWLGSTAAGHWSYYISFYSAVFVIIGPIINYLFPLLTELYKKQEKEKIRTLFKFLFWGSCLFGIIWWVVSYFLAEHVAHFVFWANFIYAGTLFKYFSPFLFSLPLIWILYQNLASRGFVKERFTYVILAVLINIFISFWLVRIYGVVGLVYWQAAGNIVLVILWLYHYKKTQYSLEDNIL